MIIILSSPSGGGKTSIAKALLDLDQNLSLSISATTRPARINEIEGKDYFFKTEKEFKILEQAAGFLETAKVYGNYYGTPKKYIDQLIEQDKDILFDIDHQGARQIKDKLPKLVLSIFILPPSIALLRERLNKRGQDSQAEIDHRILLAEEAISYANEYDYVVTNNQLDQAVNEITTIINQERKKRNKL